MHDLLRRPLAHPRPVAALLVFLSIAASPGLASAQRSARGDGTLDTASYVAMGFPPLDHAWVPADYPRMSELLQALSRRSAAQLPRYESRSSGAMFASMVDHAPLRRLQASGAAAQTRLQQANEILSASGGWLTTYNNAPLPTGTRENELVEIYALMLDAAGVLMATVTELRSQQTPEERNAPSALQGLAQMHSGVARMCEGVMSSYIPPDRRLFGDTALLRLTRHLERTMPPLLRNLPDDVGVTFIGQIDAALRHNGGRAPLVRALTSLRAAVRSGS